MKNKIIKMFVGVAMSVVIVGNSYLNVYCYYDVEKAVEYAQEYAESPNKSYHKFDSDCTNFASQCLKAGNIKEEGEPGEVIFGFRKVFDSYTSWFHKSTLNGLFYKTTQGWTTVKGLDMRAHSGYLASKKMYVRLSVEDVAELVKPGDIVLCWYGDKAEPRHTIICVEKKASTKKKVYFASHSKNYKHDSLDQIYTRTLKNNDEKTIKYMVIRPKTR